MAKPRTKTNRKSKSASAPKTAKSAPTKYTGTKKDFVLGLPRTTPAKDVVAKAAEQGIKLSANYVYLLRTKRGSRGPNKGAGRGAAPVQKWLNSPSDTSAFKRMVVEIGVPQARRIVDEVAKKLEAIFR